MNPTYKGTFVEKTFNLHIDDKLTVGKVATMVATGFTIL